MHYLGLGAILAGLIAIVTGYKTKEKTGYIMGGIFFAAGIYMVIFSK